MDAQVSLAEKGSTDALSMEAAAERAEGSEEVRTLQ